jgi:hypothetical protein
VGSLLDDAEGVDPEELATEAGRGIDCVEKEAGQRAKRDVVEMGANVGFCCLEGRHRRTPAVTECEVGKLFALFCFVQIDF